MRLSDIKNNHTKSCGCYSAEIAKNNFTTHGLSDTRLYNIWKGIIKRCNNKNSSNYKYYGGLGISIYKSWKDDFMNFYNWAMGNGYEDNLTIDRIKHSLNYTPENCQWITLSENVGKRNKRVKHLPNEYQGISPEGIIYNFNNASQFAREHDLDSSALIKVCKGKYTNHKGWKFNYINN